jgi:hypothetical protein
MHTVLLTLFIVAGADQPAPAMMEQPSQQSVAPASGGDCAGCEGRNGVVARGRGCVGAGFNYVWDWFGPMPQTCYSPRFGCYPGNERYIQRYPAFHGYYYRQPYNYTHYFDYPWHAQPHEPVGYFTYQKSPAADGSPVPAPPAVPTPAGVQDPSFSPPPAPPAPPVPPTTTQGRWHPARPRTIQN